MICTPLCTKFSNIYIKLPMHVIIYYTKFSLKKTVHAFYRQFYCYVNKKIAKKAASLH